jgi:hypothetical protein
MTEKDLFELGFEKETEYDNVVKKEYITYSLKGQFSDLFCSWLDTIDVFQDDEVNGGKWTLCIAGNSYKEVNLEKLKWLLKTLREIDKVLPNIE